MCVVEKWEDWKKFLGDGLNDGEDKGLEDERMNKVGYEIGGYVGKEVEGKKEEERVIGDVWRVGSEDG
ncbi:DUF3243 family protein, partial [Bacillus sp. WP8]|uniref:DUF3243 family protein n=1 Tax=Bacillus sp. WP8 TaxID=756828 RepID=UPI0011A818C3